VTPDVTYGDGPTALSSIHVLVVDDTREVLDLIVEIVESYGAIATAADTAEQALVLLERERPDVLLSDLEMPGHGGLWLIEQVRKLPSERGGATPAACLTARVEPEDRARVLSAGFQYHIPKPIRLEQLVGIVRVLALKP